MNMYASKKVFEREVYVEEGEMWVADTTYIGGSYQNKH